MPDYKTFKSILQDISKEHLVSKNQGEKYVMEALNSTFKPVTPRNSQNIYKLCMEKFANI